MIGWLHPHRVLFICIMTKGWMKNVPLYACGEVFRP